MRNAPAPEAIELRLVHGPRAIHLGIRGPRAITMSLVAVITLSLLLALQSLQGERRHESADSSLQNTSVGAH